MATPDQQNSRCEPAPRGGHQTIRVGSKVFMWAGLVDGMPRVHDSQEKRRFISCMEVFHSESGDWINEPTSGAPPLGVCGYGCTAVGDTLHFFGGYCNHGNCYHNSIHSLSTSSLHWVELSPTTSEGGAPMRKSDCGTVAFKDEEEDILYVVAGFGPTPSYCPQPGAQYESISDFVWCNEHHMFSLSTREWSSPIITGQPLPPCSGFTLTSVGERRAALFGGRSRSGAYSDDLYIVDLSRDTVHWTRINKPIYRSVEWPERRCSHATTCVSGRLLVIVGGLSERGTTIKSDCWIGDLTTKQWKKLSLSDSVTEQHFHSLSALQLSPHSVLLVIFGGRRLHDSANLSHTVLIKLILQEDGGQWVVGRILEGAAALEDKRVYQQMIQYNGTSPAPPPTTPPQSLAPTESAAVSVSGGNESIIAAGGKGSTSAAGGKGSTIVTGNYSQTVHHHYGQSSSGASPVVPPITSQPQTLAPLTADEVMDQLDTVEFPLHLWRRLANGLKLGGQTSKFNEGTDNNDKLQRLITHWIDNEEHSWQQLVKAMVKCEQKIKARQLARNVGAPPE